MIEIRIHGRGGQGGVTLAKLLAAAEHREEAGWVPRRGKIHDMAQTVFENLDEVRAALGTHLGTSDWLEIDQDRIDLFAEATGDHQWIHVDAERAAAGPFGATIAHGYLTLSVSNLFMPQIVEVRNISLGVNYGANKVRFPAPVKVGSRLRASAELAAVEEVKGGIQTTMVVTVEIEGSDRPACVLESVSRYLA